MFSKKMVTVIELSDETKQALARLDNDLQALEALQREIVSNQRAVLAALAGEVTRQVPVEEIKDDEEGDEKADEPSDPDRQKLSEAYYQASRQSPFTRQPRHVQVEWLLGILKDGRWHTPILIARSTANDQAHFRYLRRAIQGRMREMHEEGLVVRRDSQVGGAMFDYKLKKTS